MTVEPRMTVPFVSRAVSATPDAAGELRRAVRAFAAEHGAGPRTLAAVELAVGEAVANVVVHAGEDGAGEVRVEADIEEGELEVVVDGDGHGFDGVEVWLRFPVGD